MHIYIYIYIYIYIISQFFFTLVFDTCSRLGLDLCRDAVSVFDCHLTVETIAVLVCNQISSNSFKKEITYIIFTYKSDIFYINACKQMTNVKLLLLHRKTQNHLSLSSITLSRSSMLHPVSVQGCCR